VEVGRRRSDGARGESRYMLLRDFIGEYLAGGAVEVESVGEVEAEAAAVGEGGPGYAAGKQCEVAYVSQHSLLHQSPGRGVIESKHSNDVESPPPLPRVCMSMHPDGNSCSNLSRVLILKGPPARPAGVLHSAGAHHGAAGGVQRVGGHCGHRHAPAHRPGR